MKTYRFNLAMPAHLIPLLRKIAKLNKRSVTQEIVIAIEEYLARQFKHE